MGPNDFYTMFQLEGREAAACFTLRPEMHAPPNWGLYVDVEDTDKTAAKAAELGGKVLQPGMDVSTYGRMAVLQDPTGAIFNVWQPKSHTGTGITGVNGTLCWADLNTPDMPRAKSFYEALFGWTFITGDGKPEDSYQHIKNGDKGIGGILPESHRNKHAPPHWLIYFQVADCDASTAKAKELGARAYVEPMSISDTVRFSVLADPQGAVFALFAGR